jgi:hypothetical protein
MKASLYAFPLLVLLLAACGVADAQNVVFSAAANANKIGVADQLQVTYTVQDLEGLQSINPNFKDFKVLAGPFQSQSSGMTVVNGRMMQSSSVSLTFVLQPRKTGNIVIPPATAKDASGRLYQSNTLPVQVVSGSLAVRQPRRQAPAPSPWDDPFAAADPFAGNNGAARSAPQQRQPAPVNIGKDIFIKVDVDKKAVHIGEQVTALYKLYARIPMQVSISKLPSLNGFWTQDFDLPRQQKPFEEIVDGKRYQVFVLKKSALFPQQSGNLVLDAAEAEGNARVVTQTSTNPFDDPFFKQAFGGSLMMSDPFFSDPFAEMSYENVPVHLKSIPVTIKVSELPADGKPQDFTGAVGSFTLSSKIDKASLSTDDVATLTLKVSGSGNLKLFDAPKLNLPNGLDQYEPNILDTITGRSTTISGEKIITYTVAPRKSGDYTIPPITLSWYDPKSGSYKSASSQPIKLHVTPGKGVLTAVKGRGVTEDIVDGPVLNAARPLVLAPGYWAMYSVPLLAFIGIFFYRRREDEQVAHADEYRTKKAGNVAQRRLAAAGTMLQKGHERGFYDELSKAIWLYLSDKLGIPISSLGKATAAQAMIQRGVPEPIRVQVEQVLNECELALYAPVGGGSQQMQQSFSEAASIINGLERTLRA